MERNIVMTKIGDSTIIHKINSINRKGNFVYIKMSPTNVSITFDNSVNTANVTDSIDHTLIIRSDIYNKMLNKLSSDIVNVVITLRTSGNGMTNLLALKIKNVSYSDENININTLYVGDIVSGSEKNNEINQYMENETNKKMIDLIIEYQFDILNLYKKRGDVDMFDSNFLIYDSASGKYIPNERKVAAVILGYENDECKEESVYLKKRPEPVGISFHIPIAILTDSSVQRV